MLAFSDLVRQGKVLYLGVRMDIRTNYPWCSTCTQVNIPFIASQPQYSMLWRVIETDVIPTCQREGLGQIVWSPLAQGILTGKYQPGKPLPNQSRVNLMLETVFDKLVQR